MKLHMHTSVLWIYACIEVRVRVARRMHQLQVRRENACVLLEVEKQREGAVGCDRRQVFGILVVGASLISGGWPAVAADAPQVEAVRKVTRWLMSKFT
jgi:hypothetical protein